MARRAAPPFLSTEDWVKATARMCAKNDVAVDSDTVENVIEYAMQVLYLRLSSDKRNVGEFFNCKLFRATVTERKERMHRNPKTGEAVPKGGTRTLKFKIAPELSERMEKRFRDKPSAALKRLAAEKNGTAEEVEEKPKKKKKKLKKKKTKK